MHMPRRTCGSPVRGQQPSNQPERVHAVRAWASVRSRVATASMQARRLMDRSCCIHNMAPHHWQGGIAIAHPPNLPHLRELGLDEALAVGALRGRPRLDAVYLVAVPEHEHLAAVDLQLLAHACDGVCEGGRG